MPNLLDPSGFDTLEKQLQTRGQALGIVYDKVNDAVQRVTTAHEASLDLHLGSAQQDEKKMIRELAKRSLRREVRQARMDATEAGQDQRRAIMSLVDGFEADVLTTEQLFQSPVQFLSRQGLGTEQRSHLITQLQGAGPAELQSASDLAKATGDRVLASAVLVMADRDSKKYSQFDKAEFAADMAGEEVGAVQYRLKSLKVTISAMRKIDRHCSKTGEGAGSMTSNDKIEIGLARQQLADGA
jgi:hypothetical protein